MCEYRSTIAGLIWPARVNIVDSGTPASASFVRRRVAKIMEPAFLVCCSSDAPPYCFDVCNRPGRVHRLHPVREWKNEPIRLWCAKFLRIQRAAHRKRTNKIVVHPSWLHEPFVASGMADAGAFVVRNSLEAASEILVLIPIAALVPAFSRGRFERLDDEAAPEACRPGRLVYAVFLRG